LLEHKNVDVGQFLECAVNHFEVVSLQIEILEDRKVDLGNVRDDVEAQVQILEVGFGAGKRVAADGHDLVSVQIQNLQA
jgi:hypothetical protein